ncbi:monovalent cation:H+ antiporter-2, CPA2 family [Streptomyces sp. SceaMP-e96]|uniref:cation:proton antiporter n=1 Tax=unclassified Streptomyces TaxID=2593676 RepID=UPI000823C07D|nr:cation:proton antiporter [Streptomyces sp. SceaMP-e96]MYT16768.1 cation:proton antiporter [Streptomyces sp. SID4951]SCK34999.1 monovalent cation:H+ antiporter-2, CPA2 family [Streptomyces sp. SceaMP-e96]
MQTPVALLLELGVILAALSALGTLARRFTLSPVPLYLLTGLALGEGGIAPVPAAGAFVETGASIGVVLLLLTLGLEFSLTEFTVSMRRHVPSAVTDLILNAAPGALAGWLLGFDGVGILALAGATYISSSGIIACLLADLHRLGNRETPAVLAVLVMEDFAMAAYLPVLAVLASGGQWWQATLGVLAAVGAVLAAFAASYRWGHHLSRLVSHPDSEQLLLRVLGLTLIVAALAELVHASAAVGAFLVGLTLTGETATRSRAVLSPLRDLFAAVFFLAIGLSVTPEELTPALPAAFALAAVTIATKVLTGRYAAARDKVGRRGRLRAGTALIARGEFSLVIVGLVGTTHDTLGPLVTAYVFILAIAGPLLTRLAGAIPPQRAPRPAAPKNSAG